MQDNETKVPEADPEIALLKAANEALANQVAATTAELETLKAQVAKIEEKGASSVFVGEKTAEKLPEAKNFKVGGKTYRFKFPRFILGDSTILAHVAATDKALREKIVAEYPGVVEAIEE